MKSKDQIRLISYLLGIIHIQALLRQTACSGKELATKGSSYR